METTIWSRRPRGASKRRRKAAGSQQFWRWMFAINVTIYILTRRKIVVKPLTNKSQKARWDATKTLRYELHQLVRRILSISPSVSILPVLICTLLDIVVDTFPRVVLIETNSWPSPTQVEELPEACLDFFCRDLPS